MDSISGTVMTLHPVTYLEAARVPKTVKAPQQFGNWFIDRLPLPAIAARGNYWKTYTLLRNKIYPTVDETNIHRVDDEGAMLDVVMEDSPKELLRHMPIWLCARGRILITGLGLGCVVRGLLASPAVDHIDVIEIDADILSIIGAEFRGNPRVTLHHGDALSFKFPADTKFDYAWHDIWTEQNIGLQLEHTKLIMKFDGHVARQQGAWAFPKDVKKMSARKGFPLIGGKKNA